jgi:hypothetical protein
MQAKPAEPCGIFDSSSRSRAADQPKTCQQKWQHRGLSRDDVGLDIHALPQGTAS